MQAAAIAVTRSVKAQPVCQRRVPTFAELERRRRELGLSVSEMLAAARVHPETWWTGRAGNAATRAATLLKIAAALDLIAANRPPAPPPALIAAFVRATEEIIRQTIRAPDLIAACNPRRDRKKPALVFPPSRLRVLAIYLANVELELPPPALARALHCQRQNIHQIARAVENLRDDPRVDAVLTEIAGVLRGDPNVD